jgi:metal-responsive CopG/Arc/MetJ family transcriptional regulator
VRSVQLTLDDNLVRHVDRVVRSLKTNRSAFTRRALRAAVARVEKKRLEQRHRRGYERLPVQVGEFDEWESEQVWGD